jgi:pyridoxal phosphate enzyme (YggS family)
MTIAENIAGIRARIAETCQRAGRDPHSVTLIAVTKTRPVDDIRAAIAAGVTDFGENRPEEAAPKIDALRGEPIRWHMIGHVQSRKTRLIVPGYALVHSVDSLKLAGKLDRLADEHGHTLDVLLEINISGEASKEGFNAYGWEQDAAVRRELFDAARTIDRLPALNVSGLMTIAPFTDDERIVRPVFAGLRTLRQALAGEFGHALPQLSMGMTDDYLIAIEEGATLVRIGRAIFGERG